MKAGAEKEEKRERGRRIERRQVGRLGGKESDNYYVISKHTVKLGLSWIKLHLCLEFYT